MIKFSKLLTIEIFSLFLFFWVSMLYAQEADNNVSRGSIPPELLRPQKGEAARYPVDTVIGPLGQGSAPSEAYIFARQCAAALVAGNMNAASLAGANKVMLESYVSKLEPVKPLSYRLGGGREEADGAVSFLVRFIGREQGMTGELYVRLREQARAAPPAAAKPSEEQAAAAETGTEPSAEQVPAVAAETAPPPAAAPPRRSWIFEGLLLDEARSREDENNEGKHRFDFPPYERFF